MPWLSLHVSQAPVRRRLLLSKKTGVRPGYDPGWVPAVLPSQTSLGATLARIMILLMFNTDPGGQGLTRSQEPQPLLVQLRQRRVVTPLIISPAKMLLSPPPSPT